MIRRLIETIRIIIISPEIIIIMAIYAGSIYWPQAYDFMGKNLESHDKLLPFIPVIPLGLLAFSVDLAFKIQAPINSTNRELYDWDSYWMLKCRIIVSIMWSGFTALCSLVILFASSILTPLAICILFFISIGVGISVAMTGISALFSLKEIMTK